MGQVVEFRPVETLHLGIGGLGQFLGPARVGIGREELVAEHVLKFRILLLQRHRRLDDLEHPDLVADADAAGAGRRLVNSWSSRRHQSDFM